MTEPRFVAVEELTIAFAKQASEERSGTDKKLEELEKQNNAKFEQLEKRLEAMQRQAQDNFERIFHSTKSPSPMQAPPESSRKLIKTDTSYGHRFVKAASLSDAFGGVMASMGVAGMIDLMIRKVFLPVEAMGRGSWKLGGGQDSDWKTTPNECLLPIPSDISSPADAFSPLLLSFFSSERRAKHGAQSKGPHRQGVGETPECAHPEADQPFLRSPSPTSKLSQRSWGFHPPIQETVHGY
ncbi:hypothetical protein BDK51DRAFT_33196 [Blyttiomyces helicus]|uniref:Uncharacterized protein n=1 Tax=Blyttiomyces helicus TaxID=388810 RepID=A0A4P9WDK6_9FUNG|nr:hypothetical protein BDK51DRAFT_33196 [Blyttiomyces helicus]|eukprot:RKO89753.1 hypothetical protein BDK51DRAFT_33196 [Blyttiomyces helicus]